MRSRLLVAAVLLLGCSNKHADVCARATAKLDACAKQAMGSATPSARSADTAHRALEDVRQLCEADETTAAMYEKCLPNDGCDKFQACVNDELQKTLDKMKP